MSFCPKSLINSVNKFLEKILFHFRISVLEKERNSQIFNKKHEFRKEFCEIEELEMKMANDRMNESKSLITYRPKTLDTFSITKGMG